FPFPRRYARVHRRHFHRRAARLSVLRLSLLRTSAGLLRPAADLCGACACAAELLVLLRAVSRLLPVCPRLPERLAARSAAKQPAATRRMNMATRPDPANELKVDPA